MKAIETNYKGYRFRSRLEARWAVFFDECNAKWEYEPEGFELPNGTRYLPDFLIRFDNKKLWIEIKGEMTEDDAKKIKAFHECGNPILVLTDIPTGDIEAYVTDVACTSRHGISPFNLETVNGHDCAVHLGVNKSGKFDVFLDDDNSLHHMNKEATQRAYTKARQARFEWGEHGCQKPILAMR